MKIMTFNIQHALDYKKGKINTDLFVDAIKKYNVDFCGLNEVRGKGFILGYTDQTKAIGEGLSFNYYFGQAIKVRGLAPYGNAIVSRYNFKSVETVIIPDPEIQNEIDRDGDPVHYETRCIIKTICEIEGRDICILVTHMGLAKSERVNAVKSLCDIIDKTEMPIILMGDFNSEPDDEILFPLFQRLTSVDASEPTFPSYDPQIKIDYIFYKGLKCINSKTVEEIYADHFPIISEFEV